MWLYRKLRHKICEFSSIIYSPINRLILTLYGAKVGKKLNAFGLLHIYNVDGEITLGDHVTINSAPWANPIGGGYMTQFQIIGKGSIRIGNNTGISNCAITSAEQVSIGNNVLIGSGVRIFDTDFHPVDSDDRLANDFSKISTAPVSIGNNVFIGSSAIILKGVSIGNNSVVGAGSVVTKDIGPNEIWGGNPAKRIRSL